MLRTKQTQETIIQFGNLVSRSGEEIIARRQKLREVQHDDFIARQVIYGLQFHGISSQTQRLTKTETHSDPKRKIPHELEGPKNYFKWFKGFANTMETNFVCCCDMICRPKKPFLKKHSR